MLNFELEKAISQMLYRNIINNNPNIFYQKWDTTNLNLMEIIKLMYAIKDIKQILLILIYNLYSIKLFQINRAVMHNKLTM